MEAGELRKSNGLGHLHDMLSCLGTLWPVVLTCIIRMTCSVPSHCAEQLIVVGLTCTGLTDVSQYAQR